MATSLVANDNLDSVPMKISFNTNETPIQHLTLTSVQEKRCVPNSSRQYKQYPIQVVKLFKREFRKLCLLWSYRKLASKRTELANFYAVRNVATETGCYAFFYGNVADWLHVWQNHRTFAPVNQRHAPLSELRPLFTPCENIAPQSRI